jgi:ParB family chromosome partitioning protein
MTVREIALNKLVLSPNNMRQGQVDTSDLVADIGATKTLLHNLRVTAQHDDKGKATGKFEVHVGGRRLRALNILADRKDIARAFPVACVVCPDEATALEESIAENSVRLAPHPADQFAAFQALSLTGKTVSEIAERFSVAPRIVERRLKLATVSPRLMDLFRANELTLDHMAAFTLADDHAAQEAAYFDFPEHDRQVYRVKQRLVGGRINSQTHATAKFVGLDAYRAAGGEVVQDLFAQADDAGLICDLTLLERLASEALQDQATALEPEGWAWVETTLRFDYSLSQTYGRAYPTVMPLSAEVLAEIEQLTIEMRALEEIDPQTDETGQRMSDIEDRLYTLESSGEEVYAPEVKAITGAIVTIADDGSLRIERGCAKPGADTKALRKLDGKATENGGAYPIRERAKKSAGALPDKLVLDLTAHRTAALRAALIERHDVALVAVVHSLLLLTHYGAGTRSSPASTIDLRADLSANHPRKHAEGFEASKAGEALKHVQGRMMLLLPISHSDLWPFLMAREPDQLMELIAYAASQLVDAVKQPFEAERSARQVASDHLAKALDLDMAQWWAPTAQGYFGRVSKPLIVAAVEEATTAQAAENIAGLKKQELAAEAERRLDGKGWLPILLRPRDIVRDEAAVEEEAFDAEGEGDLDEGAPWDEDDVPMAAE